MATETKSPRVKMVVPFMEDYLSLVIKPKVEHTLKESETLIGSMSAFADEFNEQHSKDQPVPTATITYWMESLGYQFKRALTRPE